MSEAYRSRGGVVGGDEAARLLRAHSDQPISTLARWIVTRQVLSFDSQSRMLIPLFQFDLAQMSVLAPVRSVIAELAPAFDEQELAAWFVQPNAWLDGATPIDRLQCDLGAVLGAARADRFVMLG